LNKKKLTGLTDKYWITDFNYLDEVRGQFHLPERVYIHDVTLREAEQAPHVVLRPDEKMRIFQALDDLLKNEEIPNYVYDDLCRQYKESMRRLEETHKILLDSLTKRVEDLDRHVRNLEKFLGNLKVQHKTGEMSEETFKVASEYLTAGINNSLHEKKDILGSLNTITSPAQPSESPKPEELSPSQPEEEAKASPEQPEESKPSEPIVVRLRSDET